MDDKGVKDGEFVPVTDGKHDLAIFTPFRGVSNVQRSSKQEKNKSENKPNKKPKKKRIENFKNIKLLENIHDIPYEEEPQTDKEGFGTILDDFLPSGWSNFLNSGTGSGGKVDISQAITNEAFDIQQYIIQTIRNTHDNILLYEYNIAFYITKYLSFGEFIEDDVNVLKTYITWFITILISMFSVYNWFFISFYRNDVGEKVENLASELNRRKLIQLSSSMPFLSLCEPYIKFSFFFPEMLYKIFAVFIPDFAEKYFSPQVSFILLFYFIIYIFYYLSEQFCTFAEDVLDFNYGNSYIVLFYCVTIILFMVEWVESVTFNFNTISKTPTKVIKKIASILPFVDIAYYILYAIYFCIIMLITPFLGSFLTIIFILFISFFSLGFSILDNIRRIHNFIDDNMKTREHVEDPTIFQSITNIINYVFSFIYKYVFHSAFLVVLIWSFYDYTYNIQSDTLKISLTIANSVSIFFICFLILMNIMTNPSNTDKTFTEKHEKAGTVE